MQSTIKYENGNWILEDGRDGKEMKEELNEEVARFKKLAGLI